MADYWKDRMLEAQKKWTDKDIDAINKMLRHYFIVARDSIVKEFEAVYDKVLAQAEDGKPITPADLYKLDKYYQMNTQLEVVLKSLGDKTIEVLANKFTQEYKHIYSALAIDKDGKAVKVSISDKAFSTIASESAKQVASQVWCADGKTWSQRIWGNIEDLKQTLNDGLIECVVTGKKTSELKKTLMERFNVTYNRAETLVRTEMAHVETQAALDRYKEHGRERIRIIVDEDERTCKQCAEWDDKIVEIANAHVGQNCPPFHPRCRCTIAAVVEDKKQKVREEIKKKDYKPLEMGAIDRTKLDKMIKRENITDNEVVFWRFENNNGKVFYSTDRFYGIAYDFFDDEKEYHYYRDVDILARKKIREDYYPKKQYIRSDNHYYTVAYYEQNENEAGLLENMTYKEKYETNNTMFGQCIDCGKMFKKTNPQSNAQKRCQECQAKYRKKYKAEKEKERRAKKKSK